MPVIDETFHIIGKDMLDLNHQYQKLHDNMFIAYPRQGYDTRVGDAQIVASRDGMVCAVIKTSRLASCD